ncbi:MAG TPA: class I adenylate-forming enzyme family protein [Candidatus Krumholzibacteria bacterium]|nr:class I adenylate-forming enzyme family protein [Candidatus Krumholzibacteria bacterium]HPD72625.1 class I adenylate-forming enzyme family protein [Candidatus Krumholzibacteria bacterium]HRY40443.1 class I adenylate-forming enzyme family protein [Candidatus Krumholzibacteria bacterium]
MVPYLPVHRLLEVSADRVPDAVVLEHGATRLRYAELEADADRLANRLRELGVERGDRVALYLDNGREYVVGFFGILKAGACCVALNSANKTRTTALLLADSGAVGLVTRASQVRHDLPELVAGAPDLRFVVCDRAAPQWQLPPQVAVVTAGDVAASPDARPAVPVGPDDLCAILYTSGSTGKPRGATLSHRNLAANTRQILAYLELTGEDSVLSVLPFHYSFGNSLLLTHVAVGGRVVVDNRFAYPATVVDNLERSRVTGFSGVPSTYAILVARTNFLDRPWPDLRYLTQAGGAMTPALQRQLRETLPARIRLFVMYGQTEASARLSWVPPERLPEKYGSIGVGIPGVSLTVRRADGSECATGEVGEVVAQGDNIMQGYWNDPAETALVLFPDGLHTGDLGRRDEDGYIWLVDRIKNMIKTGANRVSAKEVEETIAEVAGVQEVCVVGVPDELLGEAIEAYVVLRPGSALAANSVQQHCRENLALYKVPRAVHFLAALPKNSSGKVLRQELIALDRR